MNPDIATIKQMGACSEAVDWLYQCANGDSSCSLWRKCERGDWMLWLATRLKIDRKLFVSAACDCAELALDYVPEGEDRPRHAIETARAWCRGEATLEQVRIAARAANAAAAAAAAACAAAAAAAAAANAAAHAAAAAYAAYAYNAADAAADAAYADTYEETLRKCAKLVRKRIPWAMVRDKLIVARNGK